jgi:hypothetical protein
LLQLSQEGIAEADSDPGYILEGFNQCAELVSGAWGSCRPRPRSGAWTRIWRRRHIAPWSAQTAFVVKAEGSHIRTQRQVAVAHWRNNQVPDRRIDRRQRLRNTASLRAIGDVQFRSYFLMRQLNQAIAL